jgi:hypothetical protein
MSPPRPIEPKISLKPKYSIFLAKKKHFPVSTLNYWVGK